MRDGAGNDGERRRRDEGSAGAEYLICLLRLANLNDVYLFSHQSWRR